MSKRKIYDVSPDKGKWKVKARAAKRAVGTFDTKQDAVGKATKVARNQSPSQVVIKKKDGTFQEERTYGEDPHPPKD